MTTEKEERTLNFIEQFIEEDFAAGKYQGHVHTRFPPEPNGYLHIGHAKAITVNYGIAQRYGGKFNLRFDDTNPVTEDTEYVDSIRNDVLWLGAKWDNECYASDYFQQLYDFAEKLIEKGLAYVDDTPKEEMEVMKGDPNRGKPGTPSVYRERNIAENLDLFRRMKAGEFPDGARVLRVKGDLASPNMHMRDPIIYRIKHAHHHRTGDAWCIYPMYDFAHGQSDSIEGITHSLCSLEFIHHRELYNWLIQNLEIFPSRQIEFARMNVEYMLTSKRKLMKLVQNNVVTAWDDPRMPTLAGLRRLGYPPAGIVEFCERAGVAKRDNLIKYELLEFCVREILNKSATRTMAVLDPLKVVITNYPAGQVEMLPIENNPEDPNAGTREIPFGAEVFIEREDFMETPPPKFFRLSPGEHVRLKGAYIIRCDEVIKDTGGEITELRCSYVTNSRSGSDTSGIKPKTVIHWIAPQGAAQAEVRLYQRLFSDPTPDSHEGKDYLDFINPNSLQVISNALVDAKLMDVAPGTQFQFLRKGYFTVDTESQPGKPVFNLTVSLKDSFKP